MTTAPKHSERTSLLSESVEDDKCECKDCEQQKVIVTNDAPSWKRIWAVRKASEQIQRLSEAAAGVRPAQPEEPPEAVKSKRSSEFRLKLPTEKFLRRDRHGSEAQTPGSSENSMPLWQRVAVKATFALLVVVYIVIGGTLFACIEHDQTRAGITELLSRIRASLHNNISTDIGTQLHSVLQNIRRQNPDFERRTETLTYTDQWQTWDSAPSNILFAFTAVSTVGYGHIYPVTTIGRVLCVVYTMFGIPLFMIVVADLGKTIWTAIRWLLRSYYMPAQSSENVGELPMRCSAPLVVCIFILYLLCGTVVLPLWEDLSFSEAFYFIFVSITTIGFGDFIPENAVMLPLTLVYIFCGLALSTLAIEVIAAAFRRFHYIGHPIKEAHKAGVWIGGKLLTVEMLIRSVGREVGMTEDDMTAFHLKLDELLEQTVQEIATTGRIILPKCRRTSQSQLSANGSQNGLPPVIFAPKKVSDTIEDQWSHLTQGLSFMDHDPGTWLSDDEDTSINN